MFICLMPRPVAAAAAYIIIAHGTFNEGVARPKIPRERERDNESREVHTRREKRIGYVCVCVGVCVKKGWSEGDGLTGTERGCESDGDDGYLFFFF